MCIYYDKAFYHYFQLCDLKIIYCYSLHVHVCMVAISKLLYTALNLPSLIFTLNKSETDLPSLELAQSPIFLHNPLHIIQLVQF